ncbi:hypothetical protein [Sphingomonas sp. CCH9-E2]|uniref:hypothetical protein n=1 Tax=Sphingomonas sp. CCH9-E2 TaxID=1768776 RepID=UPI000A8C85D2|nr:hypothetical protein [Sphingomonas sp. CCH9-E2]
MTADALHGRGRPLRFLATVAVGWAAMRVVLLWPEGASLPEAIEAAMPLRPAAAAPTARAPAPLPPIIAPRRMPSRVSEARPAIEAPALAPAPPQASFAMLNLVSFGPERASVATSEQLPRIPAPPAMLAPRATPDRWQASVWLVTRRGAGVGGAMLGGDQAGLRIAHTLDRRGRLAMYARATTPLAGSGRELALGVEWRPWRAPMRFLAEQRLALDGGRSGPAVAVVGGFSGVDLPFAFELEGYAQAGAVKRARVEPFADGAVRVTRDVAAAGAARLALGAGAWGAAQRDAARMDIGPTAVTTVPIAGQSLRIALDWRERIAGDARPGSGPALTLGADF